MPSFAPRSEPIKKREQLGQKENDLRIAIKKVIDPDKINKLADKYKQAQLLMLKASMHVLRDKEFQNKTTTLKIEKLERQTQNWEIKSRQEIIDEIKYTTPK